MPERHDRTTPASPGSLRCRDVADHGLGEVVWAAVGSSVGAGDVGGAADAVVADRGVAQGRDDGGSSAGPGWVLVFTECDVTDMVEAVLDVSVAAEPVLQVGGLGVDGGKGH